MEGKTELIIEQALHGYSNGHTLLASSCEMSATERRQLLFMSDLSGPLVNRKFESYFTGYAIPNSRFYVFARTWYAFEMPRPGCAWTHSLLIDISQLGRISDFGRLNELFQRPDTGGPHQFQNYSRPLKLRMDDVLSSDISLDQNISGVYKLFVNLYASSTVSLAIPAYSPVEYEAAILEIWKYQWPRLRRNFSFCSGSLNIRETNGKYLDIQIVQAGDRKLNALENGKLVLISKDPLPWVKSASSIERIWSWPKSIQSDFFKFMHRYGSDIEGSRSYFVLLADAFQYWKKDIVEGSVDELIQFLSQKFPNTEQARLLRTDFVVAKLQDNGQSKYDFLIALHSADSSKVLDGVRWNVDLILKEVLTDTTISNRHKRIALATLPSELILPVLQQLIDTIPFSLWFNLEALSIDWIINVISEYPAFIFRDELWRSGSDVQLKWLAAMEQTNFIDWKLFFRCYLRFGDYEHINVVLTRYEPSWVLVLLEWCIDQKVQVLPKWWVDFFSSKPTEFFDAIKYFEMYPSFTYPIVLNISFETLRDIDVKDVEFDQISQHWILSQTNEMRTEMLIWFFNIALKNLVRNSAELATRTVSPLALVFQYFVHSGSVTALMKDNYYMVPEVDKKSDLWRFLFPFSDTGEIKLKKEDEVIALFITAIIENSWSPSLVHIAFFDNQKHFASAIRYCISVRRSWYILSELREYYVDNESDNSKLFASILDQTNKIR